MSELSEKNTPVKRNTNKRLGAAERAQRDQEEALKLMGITGAGDSLELTGRRTRSSLRGTPTAPATPPPTKKSVASTPSSRRGKPKRLHAEEETDAKAIKIKKILSASNEEENEISIEKNDEKTDDKAEESSNDKSKEKEEVDTDDSDMNVVDEKQSTAENKEVKEDEPEEIKDHIEKKSEKKTVENSTEENSAEENSEVDGNKLETITEKEEDVVESTKSKETIGETAKLIQSKDEKVNNIIQDTTKKQLNAVEPMEVDGQIETKEDKIEKKSINNDISPRKASIELNNEKTSNDGLSSSSQNENVQKISIPSSTENLSVKSISENNISHEEKSLIEIENNKNESVEESNKNENDVCEVKLTPPGEIAASQTCK